MKKRILSLLLAMFLLVSMVPVQVFATEEAEAVEEIEEIVEEIEETVAAEETEPAQEETEAPAEETEAADETVPAVEETAPEAEAASDEEQTALWEKANGAIAVAEPMDEREAAWLYDKLSGASAADVGDNRFSEVESNNNIGYADRIYDDYTVNGSLTTQDVDFYRITINARSNIEILMSASKRNTLLGIFDSAGDECLAVATDKGAQNGYYYDQISGTIVADTYYICVLNSDGVTDSYAFYYNITPIANSPHTVANIVQGVRVRWNKVSGVSTYGVYRSTTKDGTYSYIGKVTGNSYADTTAVSGRTYYYGVCSYDDDTGEYGSLYGSKGVIFVSTPDITLRVNRARGIGLGWDHISGATGYAIYRKSYYGTDAWKRIATISDPNTLEWTDTSVKSSNGNVYKYTIRALAGSDRTTLSGCRSTGRTMVRLTSMELTSVTRAGSGKLTARWNTNTKATGYELRAINQTTGDIYKITIGNSSTSSGTYGGVPTGYEYKVQIRCYRRITGTDGAVMGFYSAWSTAKYIYL